jgi:hypothetical protein
LDLIDGELRECGSLLTTCSDRWRHFVLPGSVDRRGIKPNGYKYGEYRFTLEQNQILDLLMGENLYEERYVFVRELLQNAIDTSRHREFIERAAGNTSFQAAPIQVSDWDDNEGYHWVRFDDFGVGMNESIIKDFLLKVGRSFYSSAQFRAELIKAQRKHSGDFVPISRFGIGLLSCFMAGDRVELFSVRKSENGKPREPVRLSLNGLHGFYTLQTPPLPLTALPSNAGVEPINSSREFGTSIAVRLDPRKEQGVFNLKAEVERHLFAPPIGVVVDGEPVGGDQRLMARPWIRKRRIIIRRDRLKYFEEQLGYKFREDLVIEFIPLDVTKYSPSKNLRGQVIVARFIGSKEWKRLNRVTDALEVSAAINCHDGELSITLEATAYDSSSCKDVTIRGIVDTLESNRGFRDEPRAYGRINISDLADEVCPFEGCLGKNPKWLVHNGIFIPSRIPDRGSDRLDWDDRLLWFQSASLLAREGMWGVICLSDSLRPNVSVSRDLLLNLAVEIHSSIVLAAFRARRSAERRREIYPSEVLNHFTARDGMLLGTLLTDPLITSDNGWRSEAVFKTKTGRKTLEQVRVATAKGRRLYIENLRPPNWWMESSFTTFIDACVGVLAQIGFRVEYEPTRFSPQFVAVPGDPDEITEGHKLFPPLTFLPFKNKKVAMLGNGVLNANHRFSNWLLRVAPKVHQKYPGILKSMRLAILEDSIEAINANLDRLSLLHVDVRPPKTVFLSG